MRLVANIPHPKLKIAVMAYMDKWLIEIEGGAYKQIFKISQENTSLDDVKKLITPALLNGCMERFNGMHIDFKNAYELLKSE